jgi:beta-lactam-binding protein with PASTA domain
MSMTTRTLTRRAIELPDLVGVRADHAIQRLRELGLVPNTWSAEVAEVNEAGVVLGLDPAAGSPVRPRALITIGVAAHPDLRGYDDELPGPPDKRAVPAVTGPEVCDSFAISPAERGEDVARLQERGVLQVELW